MKKVLCAVALAAIVAPVTNAAAFTLYEKDGFKYVLQNDWQIEFSKGLGEDDDVDLVFDDLELKNRAEYDLGNGIVAFGQLDFGFKKAANDSDRDTGHLEEAYLGFEVSGATKVLFGKADGAGDMFGVADAQTNPVGDDVFDSFGAVGGDDLVYVETHIGDNVLLAADYELAADSSSSDGNGEFFSVYGQVEFVGLTVGAAFQNHDSADEKTTDKDTGAETITVTEDCNMYGVSLAYDAGVVNFGADYSIQEDTKTNPERTISNFYIGAPVGDFTLGAGYAMLDSDEDSEEVKGWYANVTYSFPMQKNLSVIFEVEDSDADNTDLGFITALRMKF